MRFGPEEAVMDDQQVRALCDCEPYRGKARVHCGRNPPHRPAVLDLQTIHRAFPIRHLGCAQQAIAIFYNVGKPCRCHGDSEPNSAGKVKTNRGLCLDQKPAAR